MASTDFNREYDREIDALFKRFPSVQKTGFAQAYKPGLERMEEFDAVLGHPHRLFKSVHVAGTNGKGSVSNMLASSISGLGHKVGLYTSPHLLDFRERMRIKDGSSKVGQVSREYVLEFIRRYRSDFERLSLSFFEITTGMAYKWFADCGVDWAVVETGLGGRLDSTNIIVPQLSVITSIGLDHCELLGHTLEAVAFEKAGIIKPGVPVVVGHRDPSTDRVFLDRAASLSSPITFAPDLKPATASAGGRMPCMESVISRMDLQGPCQVENLSTTLASLEVLGLPADLPAIASTASRMDFHGRWEVLSREPLVVCDIGHNAAALSGNFRRLEEMLDCHGYDRLVIVYAVMADKDLDAILPLMPRRAEYIFTTPSTSRALPADRIASRFEDYFSSLSGNEGLSVPRNYVVPSVAEAVREALRIAGARRESLLYIGGSTFAVAEALPVFGHRK